MMSWFSEIKYINGRMDWKIVGCWGASVAFFRTAHRFTIKYSQEILIFITSVEKSFYNWQGNSNDLSSRAIDTELCRNVMVAVSTSLSFTYCWYLLFISDDMRERLQHRWIMEIIGRMEEKCMEETCAALVVIDQLFMGIDWLKSLECKNEHFSPSQSRTPQYFLRICVVQRSKKSFGEKVDESSHIRSSFSSPQHQWPVRFSARSLR